QKRLGQLPLIALTHHRSGIFPGLAEHRQQHGDQDCDDGDHHEQFDQCKRAPARHAPDLIEEEVTEPPALYQFSFDVRCSMLNVRCSAWIYSAYRFSHPLTFPPLANLHASTTPL